MLKNLLSYSLVTLLATPAAAAPWVRSYVVTNYEPAWHFGGSAGFHKAGVIQPGSDCPRGSFPDIDYKKTLLTPWRDAKAVDALLHPPRTDPQTIMILQQVGLTFRGFRDGVDVYLNPFSAPDPGMQQVTGKIAEGFDLDNNANTGGFTSPGGERGIDNAYYRAWGCLSNFRDEPYHAILSRRADDEMITEGLYTFVVRVSGSNSPMNDDDATVEVGFSPDHVMLSPNGSVLADYSFRLIKDNEEYSKLRATVKNGVVETQQVDELHAPRIAWFPNQFGDADFHKGRLRLMTNADGEVSGLIGGYRDWRELWVEDHFSQTGGHIEQRDHQDSVGMYYAIKRNADGMRDPKSGQNTGISIAYRFRAQPAFVVDSSRPALKTIAMTSDIEDQIDQINVHRDTFYRAMATKRVQPIPQWSQEGVDRRGAPEKSADGSWKLIPLPQRPPRSERGNLQARNDTTAVGASSAGP